MAPRPPRLPDRAHAWGCLLANLTVPGLGTVAGGARVIGILQIGLSQTGFVVALVWAIRTLCDWIHTGRLPAEIDRWLVFGFAGAWLFLVIWLWSLVSSLQILRNTRKTNA